MWIFVAIILMYFRTTESFDEFEIIMKNVVKERPETKAYISEFSLRMNKISRTAQALSGSIELVEDLPRETYVDWSAYEKNGNTFSESKYLNSSAILCEWIDKSFLLYPLMLKHSNFPKKCPFKAARYELKNFEMDKSVKLILPGSNSLKVCSRLYESSKMELKLFGVCVDFEIDRSKAILGKRTFFNTK